MKELEPYEPSPIKKALMLFACIGLLTFLLMLSCCDSDKVVLGGTPVAVWSIVISVIGLIVALSMGITGAYLLFTALRKKS
jgi:hypothetical protein